MTTKKAPAKPRAAKAPAVPKIDPEERASRQGLLRWIRPPLSDPTWHLGFSPNEAACGARWMLLRMFSRPLSSGVPERKCIECQDELARMLGVKRT